MKRVLSIDEQLLAEEEAVHKFIEFFEKASDLSKIIYETWTAKDVLGHITSWHLSFERNLLSAINNEIPKPFAGSLSEINEREVERLKSFSTIEMLNLIRSAQDSIRKNITNPDVFEIVYRKGSRSYSPIEHLEIVQRHINSHLNDIKKILK